MSKKFFLQVSFFTLLVFNPDISHTQSFDPFIQQKVNELAYDSLMWRLHEFENHGIKEVGTEELSATGEWIIDRYLQLGYTDILIDSFFIGKDLVFNIIVTKQGTLFPDKYLIVDGHYDTYNGPGANDNGSGTAIILETARIMANIETQYSVRFIHFTAEELGLIGSNHYVQNTVLPENMDIRLVFNIDEVGGIAGMVNNVITCERDEWPPNGNNAPSAAFTDTLANLTQIYSGLETNISYAYGSDYVPFMENGYVVTGFYEYNESPWPHSINDSISRLDPGYVFEIARASLAATMYFSGAFDNATGFSALFAKPFSPKVTPNPFCRFVEVNIPANECVFLSLIDVYGKEVMTVKITGKSRVDPGSDLTDGVYFFRINGKKGNLLSSGKLIRKCE